MSAPSVVKCICHKRRYNKQILCIFILQVKWNMKIYLILNILKGKKHIFICNWQKEWVKMAARQLLSHFTYIIIFTNICAGLLFYLSLFLSLPFLLWVHSNIVILETFFCFRLISLNKGRQKVLEIVNILKICIFMILTAYDSYLNKLSKKIKIRLRIQFNIHICFLSDEHVSIIFLRMNAILYVYLLCLLYFRRSTMLCCEYKCLYLKRNIF